MNNILKTFAVLSTVAALAACQKAPDRSKATPPPQITGQGVDKLANKPARDVLADKYRTLVATCELNSTTAVKPASEGSVVSTEPVTPAPELPPVPQPVLNGAKLSYDVKEQARIDASMKKTLTVNMQPADTRVSVSLALRPVEFETPQVEAVGSIRRLRKHSPIMIIFAHVSQAAVDGADTAPTDTFIKLRESVPVDTVLPGNLVLSCMLAGEIAKPEYKNQNLDIDCANQNPPEELREIYRANCAPAQAEEVPAAK